MKEFITRCIKFIAKPLSQNAIWFLFTYILLAGCNMLIAWNGSRVIGLLQLFLELYIVSLLLSFFPNKPRNVIKCILAITAYIICAVDLYCWNRLGSPITPTLLNTFLQTNGNEAMEALLSYLDCKSLIYALPLLTLAGVQMFTAMCKKSRSATKRFIFKHILGIGTATSLLLATSAICIDNEIYLFRRILLGENEKEVYTATGIEPSVRFYTPIHRMANAMVDIKREKGTIENLYVTIDKSVVDSCSFTSPEIVLIIGESYNRHHSELYGYNKPTTPYQEKYRDRGNLTPFYDAIAQWNLTSDAFRSLLSTHTAKDEGEWHQYPLFTTLFRNAGYDVTFISNQYTLDADTYSDLNENILINDARMSHTQFSHRNSRRYKYDEAIVEEYETMERSTEGNGRLTIFHLMGQHIDFGSRYPAEWDKFNESMYNTLPQKAREIVAQYDNATLYNDHVLHRIISLFIDKEAIILFMPDHGERTCDNGSGYGRSFSFDKEDVRQQYEIPFWIFVTDRYREQHPQTAHLISEICNRPICTDNIAHLLLHLGGVHTPYYNKAYDPLHEEFDTTVPRIINGEKEYDELRLSF